MVLDKEMAKPIKEFPGYFVTNFGRIFREVRNAKGELVKRTFLEGYVYSGKHIFNVKGNVFNITKLVAKYFNLPNPYCHKHTRNIDGDMLNNRLDNIEWVDNNDPRIVSIEKVKEIIEYRRLKPDVTQKALAKLFNTSREIILRIFKGIYISFKGLSKQEIEALLYGLSFDKTISLEVVKEISAYSRLNPDASNLALSKLFNVSDSVIKRIFNGTHAAFKGMSKQEIEYILTGIDTSVENPELNFVMFILEKMAEGFTAFQLALEYYNLDEETIESYYDGTWIGFQPRF